MSLGIRHKVMPSGACSALFWWLFSPRSQLGSATMNKIEIMVKGQFSKKISLTKKTLRNICMSFLIIYVVPQLDFSNFKFVQKTAATEETIKHFNK